MKALAAEIGLTDPRVFNGSTEDNVATAQTGVGVVALGMAHASEFAEVASRQEYMLAVAGVPKSAPKHEVRMGDPEILSMQDLRWLRRQIGVAVICSGRRVERRGKRWRRPDACPVTTSLGRARQSRPRDRQLAQSAWVGVHHRHHRCDDGGSAIPIPLSLPEFPVIHSPWHGHFYRIGGCIWAAWASYPSCDAESDDIWIGVTHRGYLDPLAAGRSLAGAACRSGRGMGDGLSSCAVDCDRRHGHQLVGWLSLIF